MMSPGASRYIYIYNIYIYVCSERIDRSGVGVVNNINRERERDNEH